MITNKLLCELQGDHCSFNASDSYAINAVFIDGLAKTSVSLLLSDLGQSSAVNIFASPKQTQRFLNESISFAPDWGNASGWSSFADPSGTLVTPPPFDVDAFYQWLNLNPPQVQPVTIDTQYLCQIPRLKSAGSLFFSVVVADFVFLQIIWTVLTWITAYFLERQHPDAQHCVGCAKAVALGQLNLDADVEPISKPKRGCKHDTRSTGEGALEPTLTWSDSISVRRNASGGLPESTQTPLVLSDSITDELDTPSLRSATTDVVKRRNEKSPYSLLAGS